MDGSQEDTSPPNSPPRRSRSWGVLENATSSSQQTHPSRGEDGTFPSVPSSRSFSASTAGDEKDLREPIPVRRVISDEGIQHQQQKIDSRYHSEDSDEHPVSSKASEVTFSEKLAVTAPSTPPRGSTTSTSSFDLTASLHKRRGGFGRNAENNWVKRYFTLCGPILCYYDSPDSDAGFFDPSRPRGRLDLSKEDTAVEMRRKQKVGAPTELLLTVHVNMLGTRRRWEMSCPNVELQKKWYDAIKEFDGPPNHDEGGSSGGVGTMMGATFTRSSPAPGKEGGGTSGIGGPSPRRWKFPRTRNTDSGEQQLVGVLKTSAPGGDSRNESPSPLGSELEMGETEDDVVTGQARELTLDDEEDMVTSSVVDFTVIAVFGTFNVAVFLMRTGTVATFWMAVAVSNLAVAYLVKHLTAKVAKEEELTETTASTASGEQMKKATSGNIIRRISAKVTKKTTKKSQPRRQSFRRTVPAGSTIHRAPPIPNTDLAKIVAQHGKLSASAVRAYGTSRGGVAYDESVPHTYFNTDPSNFPLRIGPNYKKYRQKAPSGPALYQLAAMDFVRADSVMKRVEEGFVPPSIPGITDIDTKNKHIPPLIVFHACLPDEEPTMFGFAPDGPCFVIVMYFVITPQTLSELSNMETASPAVRLLEKWCKNAEHDPEWRMRFKALAVVEEIERLNVPGFIARYNGKPILITKSGTFTRYPDRIEMGANVRMWIYVARKGLHALKPRFPDMMINFGCTIEARKDDELPEVLLGGARVMKLDPEKARMHGDLVVEDESSDDGGAGGTPNAATTGNNSVMANESGHDGSGNGGQQQNQHKRSRAKTAEMGGKNGGGGGGQEEMEQNRARSKTASF